MTHVPNAVDPALWTLLASRVMPELRRTDGFSAASLDTLILECQAVAQNNGESAFKEALGLLENPRTFLDDEEFSSSLVNAVETCHGETVRVVAKRRGVDVRVLLRIDPTSRVFNADVVCDSRPNLIDDPPPHWHDKDALANLYQWCAFVIELGKHLQAEKVLLQSACEVDVQVWSRSRSN